MTDIGRVWVRECGTECGPHVAFFSSVLEYSIV